MSGTFFSIIIPVYNVENYLHQCVDSVLAQTFRDFEVILVDDGSPDRCPQICDEYAELDTRVRVIHKVNGGLSDARNHGITNASGKYLIFLDSDDYWSSENALKRLYTELQQENFIADVISFQATLFYPDGTIQPDNWVYPFNFNTFDSQQALYYMVGHGIFPGSAWVMAIRRKFLLDNGLYFKLGLKSEDIDWLLRLANKLPKYQYSDQSFYMYRKGRKDSITSIIDYAYLEQSIEMLAVFVDSQYANETVKYCILSYVAYQFTILMAKISNITDRNKQHELMQKMISMKQILVYDLHPKVAQVNHVIKICGFKNACRLLGYYLKYRKR